MSGKILRIGITQGDINGIGYEVILKTLSDARILEICIPVVYGSSKVVAYHRKALEMPQLNISTINNGEEAAPNRINIVNCIDEEIKVELGKPCIESGDAAIASLKKAIEDVRSGFIDVLLTAPVHYKSVQEACPEFRGQTELLEAELGDNKSALRMFVKDNLRIALATGNIPLSQVASELTPELISRKLNDLQKSLVSDFAITAPRIAVLSLNPDGAQGKEEKEIIIPAMEVADKNGVFCFGPYASDEFFGTGNYTKFDGILAMYHDQGLVPFRTLAMEDGVRFTAGLPVVRTSPNHGPAFEIAGQNVAPEDSFRNALYLLIDVFKNRIIDRQIKVNPLRKQYFEKGSDNEKLDLTADV